MKALVALLALAATAGPDDIYQVRPSMADPAVKSFDAPSVALAPSGLPADAPLAVFLPGTGGNPAGPAALLRVIAGQGYRVLSLEYDDVPAVNQVCPRDPDPACSARFRAMRSFGEAPAPVANPPAEAIEARLAAALRALARELPGQGWDGYLDGDRPRWARIVLSGQSQGAGMAAYIAQHRAVRRVVLFSSPWDFTGVRRQPAPWLSGASQTPPARWWAEYHRREIYAPQLAAAYRALAIPADHLRVFDRNLPADMPRLKDGPNPYHVSTIRDVGYAEDWRDMYGCGSDAAP